TFPERTRDEREFVEQVWARRKVGYLLDQIRVNGEKKELKEEVVALAKRYGITTPYTSWLIVPDGTAPVAAPGRRERVPDVRLDPNAPTKPTTSSALQPALQPRPGAPGDKAATVE